MIAMMYSVIYAYAYTYMWELPWWLSNKEPAASQETQETQVESLGQEDPLEKEMTTHTSILAWEAMWTKKPGRATAHGVAKEEDMT